MIRHLDLDVAVLVARAGNLNRLALATGADHRSLIAAQESGLSVVQADRYAVALGFHPAELWPAWLEVLERDQQHRDTARRRASRERHRRNPEAKRARERARYAAGRGRLT